MTLLELLVKELPKRGGWPEGADYVVQDCDGSFDIKFGSGYGYPRLDGRGVWVNDLRIDWGIDTDESYIRDVEILASDAPNIIITREQYEAAIAAQQPVWDGEGLPPVGSLVELMDDSHSQTWGDVTIKFYGDSFAVWDDHGEERSNSLCHVKVRTIRTEEDDIKREEAINAISLAYDTQDRFGNYRAATGVYEEIAAGKIPGVELSK